MGEEEDEEDLEDDLKDEGTDNKKKKFNAKKCNVGKEDDEEERENKDDAKKKTTTNGNNNAVSVLSFLPRGVAPGLKQRAATHAKNNRKVKLSLDDSNVKTDHAKDHQK